ncbi:hypothetical protein N0V88_003796 [Collariella sp. IMI 366227]|nr:hypothetical protein N0V88_003796 [Collariella sp. IMI 366227]
MEPILPRDMAKAPTLDKKAWEVCSKRSEDCNAVNSALHMFEAPCDSHGSHSKIEALYKALIPLYFDVLSEADFIAASPVTAPRLALIFDSDLFAPQTWLFVGDHRQTQPDAEAHGNDYILQLKTSTMERADCNKAIYYQLLINHRAYGNLEQFASNLFYDSIIHSCQSPSDHLSLSVLHLHCWL